MWSQQLSKPRLPIFFLGTTEGKKEEKVCKSSTKLLLWVCEKVSWGGKGVGRKRMVLTLLLLLGKGGL